MNDQWEINADKFKAALEDRPSRASATVVFPRIVELFGDINRKSILDFGCGSGRFSRALADRGASVTAYDAAPGQLVLAKEADDGRSILYSDCLETIPKDSFDFALCFQVLVCNPFEEAFQVVRNLWHRLRGDGLVAFVNTNTAVVGKAYDGGFTNVPEASVAGMPYHRHFDSSKGSFDVVDYWYLPEDLRGLFAGTGFEVCYEEILMDYFVLHIVRRT